MNIFVSNSVELQAALSTATANQTIILRDGIYEAEDFGRSYFTLRDKDFGSQGLTITAENPHKAEITGGFVLTDVTGVTIDGLRMTTQEPDTYATLYEASSGVALSLNYTTDITLQNNQFEGHDITQDSTWSTYTVPGSDNHAGGHGVWLRNTADVTIQNNEFFELFNGIGFVASSENSAARPQTSNTQILENYFHDLRSDGIRGTDHQGTLVKLNVFDDFHPYIPDTGGQGDHPDMIQFWGTNAQYGVQDFTIDSNIFYDPDDAVTAVFGHMTNLTDAERALISFENFTITNNVIVSASPNAVGLGSVESGVVSYNTLLPNGLGRDPRIVLSSSETLNNQNSIDQDLIRHSENLVITKNLVPDTYDDGVTHRRIADMTLDELGLTGIGFNTDMTDVWVALNITDGTNQFGVDNLTYSLDPTDPNALINWFSALSNGADDPSKIFITDPTFANGDYGSSLSRQAAGERLWNGIVDAWNNTAQPPSNVSNSEPRPTTPGGQGTPQNTTPEPPEATEPRPSPQSYDQVIYGSAGVANDTLKGSARNDYIDAGDGRDKILAGNGDDYIIAGAGQDNFVQGGQGADIFEFTKSSGDIKIADFEFGVDRIALGDGLMLSDFKAQTNYHNNTPITVLSLDENLDGRAEARLLLTGWKASDVTDEMFLFLV